MCRKWKKEEKEMLRQELGNGKQLPDISIPGRKHEGIWRQAKKLKLIAPSRNPSLTEEQKIKLRELRQQGFSAQQIADFDMLGKPKRTACAIQKACTRLELAGKNRSDAAKKRKMWLNGEKEGFCEFLLLHSAVLATEEIAEIFGVKKSTVNNWKKQLGVKLCLSATLALPCIRRKFREVYRQKSEKMLADFEKHILEKEKELEVLAQKMRKKKWIAALGEKRCANCGHSWPKCQKFFFHATVRKKGLTCWYFRGLCKICIAKQRHENNMLKHQKKHHR